MVPAQRQSTTSPCKPQKSLSKHQFLLSKPPSIVPYWRQHHFPLISASISIDYSSQRVSISPSHVDISWVIRAVSKIYFLCVCMSSEGPRNTPPSIRIVSLSTQPHHALSSIIESQPQRTRGGWMAWFCTLLWRLSWEGRGDWGGKEQIGKNIVIWIFSEVMMMMHGGVIGSEWMGRGMGKGRWIWPWKCVNWMKNSRKC